MVPPMNAHCVMDECTEKAAREEQGGVYVGVWAAPTYTGHLLAVDLFSGDSWMIIRNELPCSLKSC